MRRKTILTAGAAALLLLLYGMIFSFSDQDAETSSGLSYRISQWGVAIWDKLTQRNWSQMMQQELAAYFENPIRKLAHFAEYAIMGFLVHSFWVIWEKRGKKWLWISLLWVFLSAAADEIHQLFVPGRSGNVPDVLLDSLGGLAGAAVWIFVTGKNRVFNKR